MLAVFGCGRPCALEHADQHGGPRREDRQTILHKRLRSLRRHPHHAEHRAQPRREHADRAEPTSRGAIKPSGLAVGRPGIVGARGRFSRANRPPLLAPPRLNMPDTPLLSRPEGPWASEAPANPAQTTIARPARTIFRTMNISLKVRPATVTCVPPACCETHCKANSDSNCHFLCFKTVCRGVHFAVFLRKTPNTPLPGGKLGWPVE